MSEKLSENFTVEEFEHSDTAIALHINNKMNQQQLNNAKKLHRDIIQPIRDKYGLTKYDSGFRCDLLNEKVGGEPTSEHKKGNAADLIYIGGVSLLQVFNDIISGKVKDKKGNNIMIYIDQIIYETKNGKIWIHIGRRDKPRHQKMKSPIINGKMCYVNIK